MLEKPDIADVVIIDCLQAAYELHVTNLTFLPLGADRNTAVYRADTNANTPYFVKLRSGPFDDVTLRVPRLLFDQGIRQIISPIDTPSGQLWVDLPPYKLAIFPYIEGHNAYEVDMLDTHWVELGQTLKALHMATLPDELTRRIPQEDFSDHWRTIVRDFQQQVETTPFSDPIGAKLAAFMREKDEIISALVQRAATLATVLKNQEPQRVVCHADIHAGNVLITPDQQFYIVDWDTLIMAPKERDLMYVGGGQFVNKRPAEDEERLFYEGYGATDADPVALAYYRYQRIVEDIAVYCEEILLTEGPGEDRENGLRQLMRQFEPGNVIALAYRSEQFLPTALRAPDE